MTLDALQADINARLAANTLCAALDRYLEFDPSKTPAELAAQDAAFEKTMATKGLAIVILSPYGRPGDQIRGAVAWAMTVPIAVIENMEVNRAAAAPSATPPTTPTGRLPLRVQHEIVVALQQPNRHRIIFPGQSPLDRPTIGVDGLIHYYLLPEVVLPIP